jgi:hypothetical protein
MQLESIVKIEFKVGPIQEMNFTHGCHLCSPQGRVQFSKKTYILKHMDYLGLPYKLDKQQSRFLRTTKARQQGMNVHYAVSLDTIRSNHHKRIESCEDLSELFQGYRV